MRVDVWNALLDAEMNCRYWDQIARRTIARERRIKWFLAFVSSATFVSVAAAAPDLLRAGLALLAALATTGMAAYDLPGQTRELTELRAAWESIRVGYERIWRALGTGAATKAQEAAFSAIREEEAKRKVSEGKFPRDRALIRECQAEVCRARKLPAPRASRSTP